MTGPAISLLRLALLATGISAAPLSRAQNINLGETLAKWGYGADSSKSENIARWTMKGFPVQAERNRAYVELSGVKVYLGAAVIEDNGRMFVAKRDFDKTIAPILAPQAVSVPKIRTIVLDPGHGGRDPGNLNSKARLFEKTLTLDVVKRLKAILETQGYRVLVTRTKDTFMDLDERSAFANRAKADLFVSVHFNGAESTAAAGLETYCLTPAGQFSTNDPKRKASDTGAEAGNANDRWNILLGYYLQKTLVDKLDGEDRGVRRARFKVLCDLACPGALVECGYLNNPAEAARIANPVHREKIAQSIADGISLFHARVYKLARAKAPEPVKKPEPAPKPQEKKSPRSPLTPSESKARGN